MKRQSLCLLILLTLLLFPQQLLSQKHHVEEMIGKKLSEVTAVYGKPVHQDKSNPAMICVFYQNQTEQKTFVANQSGVFQAEVNLKFDNKSKANQMISDYISQCQKNGFVSDTLNVNEFNISKTGTRVNLSLFENNYSKKYEVKIKAVKM